MVTSAIIHVNAVHILNSSKTLTIKFLRPKASGILKADFKYF